MNFNFGFNSAPQQQQQQQQQPGYPQQQQQQQYTPAQNEAGYQIAQGTVNAAFGFQNAILSQVQSEFSQDPIAQGIIGAQQGMVGLMQHAMTQGLQEYHQQQQQGGQQPVYYQQQQYTSQQQQPAFSVQFTTSQQSSQSNKQPGDNVQVFIPGEVVQQQQQYQPQQQFPSYQQQQQQPTYQSQQSVGSGNANAFFNDVVAQMKKENMSSSKIAVLQRYANMHMNCGYSGSQISQILSLLSMSSDKQNALQIIINANQDGSLGSELASIVSQFSMGSDKIKCVSIISGTGKKRFYCKDVVEVLKSASMASDKMSMLQSVASFILDKSGSASNDIINQFSMSSDKQKAMQILQ